MDSVEVSVLVVALVIVLLILVFNNQIDYLLKSTKRTIASMFTGKDPEPDMQVYLNEHMDDEDQAKSEEYNDPGYEASEGSDILNALGYTGEQSWDETIKGTELDPSVFGSHREFVKDVRRFSSGANFTSVADDNVRSDQTNFIGLRRPQHVPIGESARQQPDVDQDILKRNGDLRWGNSGISFK